MGARHSGPTVGKSETKIEFVDRLQEVFPMKVPKMNNLTTIDFSGNQLRRLPRSLARLVNLNLSRNKLIEFPKKMAMILASYRSLQVLDLSSNEMTVFPEILAKLKSLKRINLSKNELSAIPVFESDVEVIDLQQNRFTEVPDCNPGLSVLFLDFNLVEELTKQIDGLCRLHMNMNRLRFIDPGLRMERLEVLEISKNHLESLPDLRMVAPNLKKLDASLNLLVEFPVLPISITDVTLSQNKIRAIGVDLTELVNLTKLEMTDNELEEVPAFPASLEWFLGSFNKIKKVAPCDVPKLCRLLLFNNCMDEFPVYENNDVKEMLVMRNLIQEINVASMSQNLVRINAADNNITEIPPDLFTLPKLTHLNLAGNKITTLPSEIKDSKLASLNISENPIKEIPNVLPRTLVSLYCSYCGLKELPSCLAKMRLLETLVACGNELTDVPALSRMLKKLVLSRNKFTELTDFFPDKLLILDFSFNEISVVPEELCCPGVLDIDLSHNQIKELPILTDCMRIRTLKLSHNPLSGCLDLRDFPFLDCLDIAFTDLEVPGIESRDIREVVVSDPRLFVSPNFKLISIDKPWVGYSEMCGQRDSMEDAVIVRPALFPGCDLYAVLDGHGGSATANFCAYHLVKIFEDGGEFSEAFVKNAVDRLHSMLRDQEFPDGSTMAMALVLDNEVITAHLGDSRVLIVKEDGSITFATEDHKPDNREEIDRILDVGGKVTGSRVDGTVAIARCLGDLNIFGVGTEPTISRIPISEDDKWLILGCDGLFDMSTNEHMASIAAKAENARNLACDLRNIAYNRLCPDNISAVTLDLKHRGE